MIIYMHVFKSTTLLILDTYSPKIVTIMDQIPDLTRYSSNIISYNKPRTSFILGMAGFSSS